MSSELLSTASCAPDAPSREDATVAPVVELARLRRDLDLRSAALNAARTHFLIMDMGRPGLPIVFVNRALAADHGYLPEELVGQSSSILFNRTLNAEKRAPVAAAMKAGREVNCELRALRRDGSEFIVGIHLSPVRDCSGEVTHYMGVGADITARLEAERKKRELQERLEAEMRESKRLSTELALAQKLEAVGRLAAGIAHEINTPIQYIGDSLCFLQSAIGDLESLLEEQRSALHQALAGAPRDQVLAGITAAEERADLSFLREEIPRAFARTAEGVERVAGIVRAMKEFAHPDFDEHSPADLNRAIATALTVACNEYKYVASVHTDFGDIPHVTCNVGQLNQVFLNLVVNAAHAIEESGRDAIGGRIEVSTAQRGTHVEITFADNGCGIAPENLGKIFDPFFTTKEVGKGTGQGLAIVRSIVVEKHGGEILVDSTPGAGTRFTLRLPIEGRPSSRTGAIA